MTAPRTPRQMATEKPAYTFEEGAERAQVEGWVCRTCRRFYGVDERTARWCCATSLPCECGSRVEKPYTHCAACRERRDAERYAKRERRPWDGAQMLYSETADRYFDDIDDVRDHADVHDVTLEDLRLRLCEPTPPPVFRMVDHLQDCLGEDDDGYDIETDQAGADAEKAVNDFANHRAWSWQPSAYALDLASISQQEGGAA